MSLVDDLKTIYIRAEVDGKWGNYSLAELPFETVFDWAMSKMPEGHGDDDHKKAAMLHLIESMGVTVYRVRPDEDN